MVNIKKKKNLYKEKKTIRKRHVYWRFPGVASGKEPACQCRRHRQLGFNPKVRKIHWRRAWQPTPVLLPGESYGQRSQVGYSP